MFWMKEYVSNVLRIVKLASMLHSLLDLHSLNHKWIMILFYLVTLTLNWFVLNAKRNFWFRMIYSPALIVGLIAITVNMVSFFQKYSYTHYILWIIDRKWEQSCELLIFCFEKNTFLRIYIIEIFEKMCLLCWRIFPLWRWYFY